VSVAELIYDWNTFEPNLRKPDRHIGFDDETLRDGLQSPSVCEPSVEHKIELLCDGQQIIVFGEHPETKRRSVGVQHMIARGSASSCGQPHHRPHR